MSGLKWKTTHKIEKNRKRVKVLMEIFAALFRCHASFSISNGYDDSKLNKFLIYDFITAMNHQPFSFCIWKIAALSVVNMCPCSPTWT